SRGHTVRLARLRDVRGGSHSRAASSGGWSRGDGARMDVPRRVDSPIWAGSSSDRVGLPWRVLVRRARTASGGTGARLSAAVLRDPWLRTDGLCAVYGSDRAVPVPHRS